MLSETARDQNAQAPRMSTGAIVGVACGAASLFLLSGILLTIYCIRQRQYQREEDICWSARYQEYIKDERYFLSPSSTAPFFTLDYKLDQQPEALRTQISGLPAQSVGALMSQHASYFGHTRPISEMVSAMPTHPAYIPRALVRSSLASSVRFGTRSVRLGSPCQAFARVLSLHQRSPGQRELNGQQDQPVPAHSAPQSTLDDYVMQAFLKTADGELVDWPALSRQQPVEGIVGETTPSKRSRMLSKHPSAASLFSRLRPRPPNMPPQKAAPVRAIFSNPEEAAHPVIAPSDVRISSSHPSRPPSAPPAYSAVASSNKPSHLRSLSSSTIRL